MNSASLAPAQKLTVGAIATALATVILWVLGTYANVNPPPDVSLAIGSLVGGIVYFVSGYIAPPSANDVPVQKATNP